MSLKSRLYAEFAKDPETEHFARRGWHGFADMARNITDDVEMADFVRNQITWRREAAASDRRSADDLDAEAAQIAAVLARVMNAAEGN